MSSSSQVPHYKTLDIVTYYNEVYDFVSKYLIFVIAGLLSIVGILIIWIWEPSDNLVWYMDTVSTGNADAFVQETGLIYPVNYYAAKTIDFDDGNKIYGLGGPIWSSIQEWTTTRLWNSIDNIVQYNGVILPRQISRSAWVPKLQQPYYSESMINVLLDGMANSQTDVDSIMWSLTQARKDTLDQSMFDTFRIWCSNRKLFITKFCDLKIHDTIATRNQYDLSWSVAELSIIKNYVFDISNNRDNQQSFCNIMIKQYRYSGHPWLANLMTSCDSMITNEVNYIGNMIAINEEISSNTFTNKIYNNPTIDRYKLMSRYQYLMGKINGGEYIDSQDDDILRRYDAYITKIASSNGSIAEQPYGDIITVFHQQKLIPWLQNRDAFASTEQKAITEQLINTTNLIINGDAQLGIESVTKWSRLRSIDFLISEGLYDPNSAGSWSNLTETPSSPIDQWSTTPVVSTPIEEPIPTEPVVQEPTSTWSTLTELITKVLGIEPTSFKQNGDLVIIQYPYKGKSWFAAVNIKNRWDTQLYYNSDISGAVKITHPKVIFNSSDTELMMAIMNNFLSTNPQ